jgi:hypothetical protein
MKSRSEYEWLNAYGRIHQELTSRGFKTKLKTLDNEASSACKGLNDVEYHLFPPHFHRCITTERAITFCSSISISGPGFSVTLMGSSFATSTNEFELTAQIQAASTIICRITLSRHGGLQQTCFCSTSLKYHST